jgi:hypothetical protein
MHLTVIQQDDREDWEVEAAKMKTVYANAYLTIAAATSSDHGQGFLKPRTSSKTIELELSDFEHAPDGIVLARRDLHRYTERSPFQMSPAPLFERGWIYQERLLSARVLYFEDSELLWDCRTDVFCECGDFPQSFITKTDSFHVIHNLYMLSQAREDGFYEDEHTHCHLVFDENDSGLYDWWHQKAVVAYAQLKLTKESDRLPALSGLAGLVAQKTGDVYLAGLWRKDLIRGLQWHSVHKDSIYESYLPYKYRAPSWSWVSVEGSAMDFPKIRDFSMGSHPSFTADAMVLNSSVSPLGKDILSEIVDGRITLLGEAVSANLRMQSGPKQETEFLLQLRSNKKATWTPLRHSKIFKTTDSPLTFHPDVNITLTTIETANGTCAQVFERSRLRLKLTGEVAESAQDIQAPVTLLRLGTFWGYNDRAKGKKVEGKGAKHIGGVTYLVLSSSARDTKSYERIGLLIWNSEGQWSLKNEQEHIQAAARIHEQRHTRIEATVI